MSHRIVTFTLNPAYDLIGYCQNIELGDVNLVSTNDFLPAGKGINVAKVLCDLEHKVTASGFLGDLNREAFSHLFSQLGIEDKFSAIAGRTRINVKLTEESGSVTDLNFSGFTVDNNQWQSFAEQSLSFLSDAEIVVISGSLPKGIDLTAFSNWIAKIKTICPKVIFDSSRDALAAGLKAKPWLIKPNDKELEMLVGYSLSSIDEIKKAAFDLVSRGIENVIVSLGSKGALWVSKQEAWIAKPPKCKVTSTVGAGDTMVAGIVHGLLSNYSIKQTLIFACAVSALSVSQAGVGIADKTKLNEMIEQIEIIAG